MVVAALKEALLPGTALDGELVAFDKAGSPSFRELQGANARTNVVFFVFDLLATGGKDVKSLPLRERLALLSSAFTPSERVQLPEHFAVPLGRFLEGVKQIGGEGVVAKRLDSPYEPGRRSGSWSKMRITMGQEFVIGGFTPGSNGVDALVVGYYEKRKLMRIWENLGLGPLERIDLRPLALSDAIDSIRHAPPARTEDIPIAWETASRDNPHLSGLSKVPIHAYLVTTLDGREPLEAPRSAAHENLDVPSSTAPLKVRAGREPFWYWLLSVEDQWLKAACVITVLMVAIGGRFAWAEYSNRQVREIEWEQIHHARDAGDYSGMLDAAESFLSHPLMGEDQRVPEIEVLYSEAIVLWFERDQPQGEALNKRLAKYRELHGNATSDLQASQSSQ